MKWKIKFLPGCPLETWTNQWCLLNELECQSVDEGETEWFRSGHGRKDMLCKASEPTWLWPPGKSVTVTVYQTMTDVCKWSTSFPNALWICCPLQTRLSMGNVITKSGLLKPCRWQNSAKIEPRCQSLKIRNQVDAIIIKTRKVGVAANRSDLQCYEDGGTWFPKGTK